MAESEGKHRLVGRTAGQAGSGTRYGSITPAFGGFVGVWPVRTLLRRVFDAMETVIFALSVGLTVG